MAFDSTISSIFYLPLSFSMFKIKDVVVILHSCPFAIYGDFLMESVLICIWECFLQKILNFYEFRLYPLIFSTLFDYATL